MKSTTINGRTFHVGIIPARKALRTMRALAAVIGPSLGVLMKLKANEQADGAVMSALPEVFARFGEVDDQNLASVIDDLASVTRVEVSGTAIDLSGSGFDAVFTGKMGDVIPWLVFAIEVNFGDFIANMSGDG